MGIRGRFILYIITMHINSIHLTKYHANPRGGRYLLYYIIQLEPLYLLHGKESDSVFH